MAWQHNPLTADQTDPRSRGLHLGASGLIVVDEDAAGAVDAWIDRGELPATFEVRTPKGLHRYYRAPAAGAQLVTRTGVPGVDLLAGMRYAVAPGAVVNGTEYVPANDLPIADAPAWLVARCSGPAPTPDVEPGMVRAPNFFDPTASAALDALRQRLDALRARNPAPNHGHRAAIRDVAYYAGGLLHTGAFTDSDAFEGIAAACAAVWGRYDDEDAKWIEQGIRDGARKPLPVRTDSDFPARQPTSSDPGTAGAAGDLLAYDSSELDVIPDPVPLLTGLLHRQTLAVLSGKFGTYKTFVALAWAASLATGVAWSGHTVPEPVPVVYVAAEGSSGIRKRLRAWRGRFLGGAPIQRGMLTVVPKTVNLGRPESVFALERVLTRTGARLVVIDTLHRCTPGLDENSNTEMGVVIGRLTELIERHGASVLMLHHTGHDQSRSRGASSIEDDADTVFLARFAGQDDSRGLENGRVLEHRKSKDGELSTSLPLLAERRDDSLVVTSAVDPGALWAPLDDRSARARLMAERLRRDGADPQKTVRALRAVLREDLGEQAAQEVLDCAIHLFRIETGGKEDRLPVWYTPDPFGGPANG